LHSNSDNSTKVGVPDVASYAVQPRSSSHRTSILDRSILVLSVMLSFGERERKMGRDFLVAVQMTETLLMPRWAVIYQSNWNILRLDVQNFIL
jgi:hypothetical protein